jgi:hypothetical protein
VRNFFMLSVRVQVKTVLQRERPSDEASTTNHGVEVFVAMPHAVGSVVAPPRGKKWSLRTLTVTQESELRSVRRVSVAPSKRYTVATGKCGWGAPSSSGERLALPKGTARIASSEDFAVAVTNAGAVFFIGACADFKSASSWLAVSQPAGAVVVDAVIPSTAKFAILRAKDGKLFAFGQSGRAGKSDSPRIEPFDTPGP